MPEVCLRHPIDQDDNNESLVATQPGYSKISRYIYRENFCYLDNIFRSVYCDSSRKLSWQLSDISWQKHTTIWIIYIDLLRIAETNKFENPVFVPFQGQTSSLETNLICWYVVCKRSEIGHVCGICRRQCHYEFNTVFWKSCIVFCAEPKAIDPI